MILPRFEFIEPHSLEEACSALKENAGKAKVIAGGTDLLVNMKKKLVRPAILVSLDKIPRLREMSFSEDSGLRIGSLLTLAELVEARAVRERFSALARAASELGSPQVRERGTIGGNICSARPAADTLGPLIGYGAEVKLFGSGGERVVPLEEFCTGPGQSVLGPAEILVEIFMKSPPPNTCSSYIKFGARNAGEIAIVNATSVIALEAAGGKCRAARIVLGAVAPTYIRCPAAEEALIGSDITEELALWAGTLASQSCQPISDIRGSAEYRKMLVEALTRRTILEAGVGEGGVKGGAL